MKTYLFTTSLLLASIACFAQMDIYQPVVRIETEKEGLGIETGAGIIVGQKGAELFIATAFHVVEDGKDLKVLLYKQTTPLKGTLLHHDKTLDVAVVKITAPTGWAVPRLMAAEPTILKAQQKVVSMGHPGGSFWKPNYLNITQEISIYNDDRLMSITPQAVVGGCSGGPVFTLEGIWLSMVTETSMVEAKAVKAHSLVQLLKQWAVPVNLTLPEEPALVNITGGSYQTNNATTILKNYALGKYEVTYADFKLFIAATGYVTDAEKEGFSFAFYNRSEGGFIADETEENFRKILEHARKQIENSFQGNKSNLQSANPVSDVGKRLYEIFDYSDYDVYGRDPMYDFLYELFDYSNYYVQNQDLRDLVEKMQRQVNSYYPRDSKLETVFKKLQERIRNEFNMGVTTYDLTKDMEELKKVLLNSFDPNNLRYAAEESMNSISTKYKYLNLADWRHNSNGSLRLEQDANHPVIHVSYNDAKAYCEWLSRLHGKKYRLPTVAEWEYATSQRGLKTTYTIPEISAQSNLRDRSFGLMYGWGNCYEQDDKYANTSPVGAFAADKLGLCDIMGNVSEWCSDTNGAEEKGINFQHYVWDTNYKIKVSSGFAAERRTNFRSAMLGFRVVRE
ncbi:MAG: hypothetical protein OHK0019_21790 [Saprospiraceae bacterium]